jgi:peptidoglycan/LPS O-acetylase OafA/YrhL
VSQLVRAFAVIAGIVILALGLWAFFSPQSFYDQTATWPPYNKHFLHDVGAFQAGLGATLILAAFARDALLVALSGAAVGSVIHAIAHFIDRGNGGRASDPALLGVLAALIVAAAILRARELPRSRR